MNISLIIPTLNESFNIGRAVERAEALAPNEIIVADGGSHDDTVEQARERGAIVIAGERGRAVQQNAGARRASGDVLLFLHADCWLAPGGLQQIADALRDARVLGGAFRHRIEADGLLYRLIERGDSLRAKYLRLPYGDQGVFVRRRTFFELGGFPETRLMEDVLFIRRLRKISRIPLLPGPVYSSARRWRKHGVVRQTLRNWSILAAEKLGVSPDRLADYYVPHAELPSDTSESL